MKRLTIALIFSVFFSGFAISCTCTGEATFCQELQITTDLYPQYVIRATKLADIMHGMVVKIEKQYINEIEEETITVWGDPGHLCRVYTSNFAIGEEIILSINKFEQAGEMAGESIGDYYLSVCGVSYLEIENGMVTGPILTDVNSMTLAEFECYMFNEEYLTSCSSTNIIGLVGGNVDINVFPNPTSDFATIILDNNECVPNLRVYNAIGQEQRVDYNLSPTIVTVDFSNLIGGIYFLKISFLGQDYTRKIIVSRN